MKHNPKRVVWMLCTVMLFMMAHLSSYVYSRPTHQQPRTAKNGFSRPAPTRKIRPEIPDANRNRTDMVFLEYADSLYARNQEHSADEFQILKGNVKFRQGGMYMYCDSAYYYPEFNSLDAFGHVKMEQGDTLFVYSDVLYFDGENHYARLRNRGSQKVKLENRDVTLTTDSLDYSMREELGWFYDGGRIEDKQNVLTSVYGQYSPATKEARFFNKVKLENRDKKFVMETDTLLYNTRSHVATIVSPTKIKGEKDTIITRSGWYNTSTDEARLDSRSLILHTDTAGNVTTLEGDSIIYDKISRISRAYSFRDRSKKSRPMVITDTLHKSILTGGYGFYNDSTKEAFATDYPLLMEFSRPDTLFLRADSIKTLVMRVVVEAKADSLSLDSISPSEPIPDSVAQTDSVSGILPDSIPRISEIPRLTESADSTKHNDKEYRIAKAYHRARFFRKDIQGVADSIQFVEKDSVLYLFVKPILWSDERQVTGNEIHVHFNDSTVDHAYLPDMGMMSESIGEDFYNQLSGKKMRAFFEDGEMKRLEVDGNVQIIFLPMEKDSTYNKLVYAESGYMSLDVTDRKMDKLSMWPDVSGQVTPVFLVKKNQMYLPGFQWYSAIRPRRQWYGSHLRWEDELGDIPDELENYFNAPTEMAGRRKRSAQTKIEK